ncbi:MAG TPA: glycerate kinase [Victivallales bacterium]|nr:glycerate kinase [Victivallales bacterium]
MKIIIAPNSFKGSLSAQAVANSIMRGIRKAEPDATFEILPIADGGDGLVDILVFAKIARLKTAKVSDPLGRKILANFAYIPGKKTAIIEMALASGLALLKNKERNPLKTTSKGVGELIAKAVASGAKKIILGIGGSATCEGGIGALSAMGVKFFGKDSRELSATPENLCEIREMDITCIDRKIAKAQIEIACDVENPLLGKNGAANVYAPQKGANKSQVKFLESGLANFAKVIKNSTGISVKNMKGAGAAGGIGASLHAVLGAKMSKGTDIVFSLLELKQKIKGADLVITGEGRMDFQTAFGKAPAELAKLAKKEGIPCIAICGSVGDKIEKLRDIGISEVFPILKGSVTLEEAMKNASRLISLTAEDVMGNIKFNH